MIGIFGGTFDPVHFGHLRSALELKALFELDHVRLIPCMPSHRSQTKASAHQRLDMLELAVGNQGDLIIDAQELERGGCSYTFDTLTSLRHHHSQTLLLFIGSDAFNQLTSWHRWQELFDLAHIIVITRPDTVLNSLSDFFKKRVIHDKTLLKKHNAGGLFFQEITQLAISATAIRGMIAAGCSPRFLLPDAVINYITQHQLYQD